MGYYRNNWGFFGIIMNILLLLWMKGDFAICNVLIMEFVTQVWSEPEKGLEDHGFWLV